MVDNDINITDLPNEVIENIIKFLPHSDKKCLRTVNKQFYSISIENKRNIKNEYFYFYKDSCVQDIIKILLNSQREFYCFAFYKVDFSEEILKIFDKFNKITSLELIECNIDDKILTQILLSCKNLQNLKFYYCKSLFMQGVIFSNCEVIFEQKCPNLKSLSFENSSYLSDYILDQFIQVCPNVETLSFVKTPINFHKGLCKRFYKEIYDKPANSVLTFFFMHKIITVNATKIKSLNYSGTRIDGESLSKLCSIPNLKLETLNLSDCKEIRKSFPLTLGDWQQNLVSLNLKSCAAVNNDILENIFNNMPNLFHLNIEACKGVNQDGLKNIKNLKKLKTLNISDCAIAYILAWMDHDLSDLSNLVELHCQNITLFENTLQVSFDPNIELKFLKNLTYLDLSYIDLKDKVLQAIIGNSPRLESLVLFRCVVLTDNCFINENHEELVCMKKLKGLKSINMDFCNITDTALIKAFNFLDLRSCSLNNTKVTSAGINSLVKKCPRIEVLNLNECDIDNTCIENIATLKKLHSLSLANCRKLEEPYIELLVKKYNCFNNFNIGGLTNISQEFVNKLFEQNFVHQKFTYSIVVTQNYACNREAYKSTRKFKLF